MIRLRGIRTMIRHKFIYSFFFILMLTNCTTIPFFSLFSLARVNFESTELEEFRIGIKLPDGIRPEREGIKLETILKISGEKDLNTTFILVGSKDITDEKFLSSYLIPEYKVYSFKLSPQDIQRFQELRKKSYDNKKLNKSVSLGFGISIKEFCIQNALLDKPIQITTFIKTSEIGKYIILTKEHDLREDKNVILELNKIQNCI